VADFRQFISVLEGGAVAITHENFHGLCPLYDEFGLDALAAILSFQTAQAMANTEALGLKESSFGPRALSLLSAIFEHFRSRT
jgi:hypothetical protein